MLLNSGPQVAYLGHEFKVFSYTGEIQCLLRQVISSLHDVGRQRKHFEG